MPGFVAEGHIVCYGLVGAEVGVAGDEAGFVGFGAFDHGGLRFDALGFKNEGEAAFLGKSDG